MLLGYSILLRLFHIIFFFVPVAESEQEKTNPAGVAPLARFTKGENSINPLQWLKHLF